MLINIINKKMYLPLIPEEKEKANRINDVIIDIETGYPIDIETGNPLNVEKPYVIPIESDSEDETVVEVIETTESESSEDESSCEDDESETSDNESKEAETTEAETTETESDESSEQELVEIPSDRQRKRIVARSRPPLFQALSGHGLPSRSHRYRRPGSLLTRRRLTRYPSPLRPRIPTPTFVPPSMKVLDTEEKLTKSLESEMSQSIDEPMSFFQKLVRSNSSPSLKNKYLAGVETSESSESRPSSTTPLLKNKKENILTYKFPEIDLMDSELLCNNGDSGFKWIPISQAPKQVIVRIPEAPPAPPVKFAITHVNKSGISFKEELQREVGKRVLRRASANIPPPLPPRPLTFKSLADLPLPPMRPFRPLPPLPKKPLPLCRRPLPPLPPRSVTALPPLPTLPPTPPPLPVHLLAKSKLDQNENENLVIEYESDSWTTTEEESSEYTYSYSLSDDESESVPPPPPSPPLPPIPEPPSQIEVDGWDIESLEVSVSETESANESELEKYENIVEMEVEWLKSETENSSVVVRNRLPTPPPVAGRTPETSLEESDSDSDSEDVESSYIYEYDTETEEESSEIAEPIQEEDVSDSEDNDSSYESHISVEETVSLSEQPEQQIDKQTEEKQNKTSRNWEEELDQLIAELKAEYQKSETSVYEKTRERLSPLAQHTSHRLIQIEPMSDGGYGSFASVGDVGKPLLDEKKSLLKRATLADQIKGVRSDTLRELHDNFDEMFSLESPPDLMIERLQDLKEWVLTTSGERVILSGQVDGTLLRKINEAYTRRYGSGLTVGRRYQWDFPKGRLLAVIDHLILKYRGLAEDRKLLDFSEDIGEEMADVVEEFAKVKEEIKDYNQMDEVLKNLRNGLCQAKVLALKLGLIDEPMRTTMSNLEKQVTDLKTKTADRREPLIRKSQVNQAKFNYYAKMAQNIKQMVCWEDFAKLEKELETEQLEKGQYEAVNYTEERAVFGPNYRRTLADLKKERQEQDQEIKGRKRSIFLQY